MNDLVGNSIVEVVGKTMHAFTQNGRCNVQRSIDGCKTAMSHGSFDVLTQINL